MMPRLLTSSANSRGLQWLTGRPLCSGDSQATAISWQICSAVYVAGRPARGSSAKTSSIAVRNSFAAPSRSIPPSWATACFQRPRHNRTVSLLLPSAAAIAAFRTPSAALRTMVARSTSLKEVLPLRVLPSNIARCWSVSSIVTGCGPGSFPMSRTPLFPASSLPPSSCRGSKLKPPRHFRQAVLVSLSSPVTPPSPTKAKPSSCPR
jgi:hypothetical protein